MTLRIASLVPSLTELVAALGLAPLLVARTGFCIHPVDVVRSVPKVGGTKDVDLDKLRRLAPTHVIVNIERSARGRRHLVSSSPSRSTRRTTSPSWTSSSRSSGTSKAWLRAAWR